MFFKKSKFHRNKRVTNQLFKQIFGKFWRAFIDPKMAIQTQRILHGLLWDYVNFLSDIQPPTTTKTFNFKPRILQKRKSNQSAIRTNFWKILAGFYRPENGGRNPVSMSIVAYGTTRFASCPSLPSLPPPSP